MLEIESTKQFKKDIKRFVHKKSILLEINEVINCLQDEEKLAPKHLDHPLTGDWVNHRECHIKNDLLLIYRTDKKYLYLERIGSHSELF
jgi:mRNA interferase YafQ